MLKARLTGLDRGLPLERVHTRARRAGATAHTACRLRTLETTLCVRDGAPRQRRRPPAALLLLLLLLRLRVRLHVRLHVRLRLRLHVRLRVRVHRRRAGPSPLKRCKELRRLSACRVELARRLPLLLPLKSHQPRRIARRRARRHQLLPDRVREVLLALARLMRRPCDPPDDFHLVLMDLGLRPCRAQRATHAIGQPQVRGHE